ncbi:co-chaperone GroES [Nafulsella turpanensis]|uniref:co-chaperone GroES n=1 Tax=Nafulsella turpanensis TaxID=1265690 RepID=UPI0003496135|nr:co-chaperone GroES family protein [Nafulsella turpanensis]
MKVTEENKLKKIIIIGDRVLIKPKKEGNRTNGGLYLPPGVQERDQVRSGYVMKTGPGYAIPLPADEDDEPWKEAEEKTRYIPLQAKEGDLAVFLQKGAFEVVVEGEKYFVVPQASILLLERDEDLFS